MKFVIATHAMLLLVDIDSELRVRDYDVLNTGYHYGLGLVNGSAAGVSTLVAYHGGPSVFQEDEKRLLFFDGDTFTEANPPMRLPEPIGSVHQIAAATGGLFIANTGHNSVTFITLDGAVRHDYVVDGVTHDRNHVNSVFPAGNEVFVLLHNRFRQESEILVLHHDLEAGFTLRHRHSLWHLQAHNLFVDGRRLAYNASSARQFVVIDLDSDRIERGYSFEHHSKGLSVTDEHYVLGLSEYAARDERSTTRGDLVFIERSGPADPIRVGLELEGLPGPIGNINEVRCVSGEEIGHAQELELAIPWEEIKLAKRAPVGYWARRANTKLLRPPRRAYERFLHRARGHT